MSLFLQIQRCYYDGLQTFFAKKYQNPPLQEPHSATNPSPFRTVRTLNPPPLSLRRVRSQNPFLQELHFGSRKNPLGRFERQPLPFRRARTPKPHIQELQSVATPHLQDAAKAVNSPPLGRGKSSKTPFSSGFFCCQFFSQHLFFSRNSQKLGFFFWLSTFFRSNKFLSNFFSRHLFSCVQTQDSLQKA